MSKIIETTTSEENALSSKGYKVIKKLGQGSFGWVYLTEYGSKDDKSKSHWACKVVDTTKAPKDYVKKFLPRELDILMKLNHPHIIYVQNIFLRKEKYFIFMRFAENGDLLEFILKKGAVTEAQSRVWVQQISLALQYLHEMEIAHRDMKCENTLLSSNFNVKLADFGFARYVIDESGKRVTSDTHCGSLTYAAPEVLKGNPYHPKISDMWSLGVMLYVMLNKAMPFGDDSNIKKLYDAQINKKWRFRSKVADILSEHVKECVSRLLEPDVAKRWNVDQVLSSSWIAMDSRLTELNQFEKQALAQAHSQKKNANVHPKALNFKDVKKNDEMTVLKQMTDAEAAVYKRYQSSPTMREEDLRELKQK